MTRADPPPAAIVDASVAIKWVLPEVGSDSALRLQGSFLAAPDFLLVECANALWKQARRGRISREEADQLFAELGSAPLLLVPAVDLVAKARTLAHSLDHPIYDCLYLALATLRDQPLVTDDGVLARAAARHAETRDRVIALATLT